MDDTEFLRRLRQRIEESSGTPVELELDHQQRDRITVDFSGEVARVVMGADVLTYPGLARMFMQYAILCLKERRKVSEQEFLLFLRRN